MLGFVEQVDRQPPWVGGLVGDDQALGRPAQHLGRDTVALGEDLGGGHRRAARPDDLAHPRDRGCAERQGRDPGRAVRSVDLADAQLVGDGQGRRIHGPTAPRDGRDEDNDPPDPGDDGGRPDLAQDRRIRRLAGGHEQADRRDRCELLPDDESGPDLGRPGATGLGNLGLVEQAAVGDRLADSGRAAPDRVAAWAAAISALGTRSASAEAKAIPSNSAVASRTAASPRSATSRKIASIEAIRAGSKIAAVERASRRSRSAGSRLDQRRTARMAMTGAYPTAPAPARSWSGRPPGG